MSSPNSRTSDAAEFAFIAVISLLLAAGMAVFALVESSVTTVALGWGTAGIFAVFGLITGRAAAQMARASRGGG